MQQAAQVIGCLYRATFQQKPGLWTDPLDQPANLQHGDRDFFDGFALAMPLCPANIPSQIKTDHVQADISGQSGLGAGCTIEHRGQPYILNRL